MEYKVADYEFCALCGGTIPKSLFKHKAKYCSAACRQEKQRQKYHGRNPDKYTVGTPVGNHARLSPGTVGTISELRVAIDLLCRGYEVFRAMSPHSSCDLAILKDGKLYRIEVTTGHYSASGKVIKNRVHIKDRYDIFATAMIDQIIYEPKLPSLWPT